MRKQLIVLMVFLLGLFSFGAESNYSIKKVEVINNREIPFEIILENMRSKEGEKFVTDNMIEDYKSIKGLEYVNDVSIQPTVYDGGIKLTVDITENRDAKSMLEKKGIIPLSERGKVDTSLLVNSIEFIGNHYVSTKELMDKVPVKVGSYFSKNKVIEGHKNLIESGYFRDVIPDAVKSGKGVKVIYEVMENPILNGVNIIGNTVYSTEDLMKVIQTEPGKIFNINTIREDRDRILKKYQDDGYTLTDVTDIGINGNLELEIYLSEGTVRDIQFKKMVTKQKGARRKPTDDVLKTKTYVIERELEFSKDEIFNSNKYDETVKNLMRLGHFKNVKYESRDIPGDPDGKTIILLLDEERTAILQGAISYGSEIGLLGTISIKDTNWKGKGQELGFTFEKSDEDYTSFSINFYDPWIKDTDRISWGWSLYKNSYEDDDSKLFHEIDTIGAKFNIGKGLTKNVRLSLGTKFEYVEEKAQKNKFYKNGGKYYWSNGGEEVQGIDDDYFIWSLFPSLTYDTRNHFWNPTAGEYAKLQLEGGYAGGYDGDIFGNITLELRKYHRGFFKNNTFAYKVVGGIMTDSTKETQRFWVGGGSTLRGYDGGFFKRLLVLLKTELKSMNFLDLLYSLMLVEHGIIKEEIEIMVKMQIFQIKLQQQQG